MNYTRFEKLFQRVRLLGPRGVARQILPARPITRLDSVIKGFENKTGLEIGGPSRNFQRFLPVYRLAERIDNCNFSAQTVWTESANREGEFHHTPGHSPGKEFYCEATDLNEIEDGEYDFVMSSHMLEHVANPIKALAEQLRVLKPGGHLAIFLPHKEGAFDHRRPTTTLAHMIEDYERNVGEDDMTHFTEIMALHDLSRDPGVSDPEEFRQRSLKNAENRCFHQHVFDTPSALQLIDYMGVKILFAAARRPSNILIVAQKTEAKPDNAELKWTSEFKSDLEKKQPFKAAA